MSFWASPNSPRIVGADGEEKERRAPVETEANVADEMTALRWTGRTLKLDAAARRFVFSRTVRVRDDKGADAVGVRMAQVLDRELVPDMSVTAERVDLPKSSILQREVYTKTTKGKLAVRKLLMWQTNKEQADAAFSGFVVHFTDYRPGRTDPIKREVRRAPSLEAAEGIAEEMITKNIEKGWVRADA